MLAQSQNKTPMVFLSSIPRSGSTLLTSLLNQRSDTYATPTSNLCNSIAALGSSWEVDLNTTSLNHTSLDIHRSIDALMGAWHDTDKMVFDKGRTWAEVQAIELISNFRDVKIVVTVRPIVECVASLVRICEPEDVEYFCKSSRFMKHLRASYLIIKEGYSKYPDKFLVIEYCNLVSDTQKQMDRISSFVGVCNHTHDLNNIPQSKEDDTLWGVRDLHLVRKRISKCSYSAEDLLGPELFKFYSGGEFWNDKPEPIKSEDVLDLQLEACLHGEFVKANQISERLLVERPRCNRVKFNAGWHKLYAGDLQQGHKYLDCGREESVFGDSCPSGQPRWNGEKGTVLLNMEGGLGDQIKSYRFAQDIQDRGNRVVIACSRELASIFAEKFITVQHEAAGGVCHDYWLPSMSAIIPLGYEYADLKGEPYIDRTADPVPGRIGVRWSGNPTFEHEQHRFFPADLMFDAVKGYNCVSLQRDKDAELKPKWMEQAPLDDWQTTRKSISECELVITSCTSIAHLSAAMGIKTLIVVPILPYYLWALPGDKTPYYDSVTLFRQEQYGDWSAPFKNIKEKLKCMHMLKMAA
jgi:hypothetical protein